ncbi:MAG: hypothetical protein Q9227_005741 [Pyrenula ochraceoflavens]
MVVGRLSVRVVLDSPGRPIVGSEDYVSGKLVVSCFSGEARVDIFGPLKLQVLLHGRAKSKIIKSNGQSRSVYRGRAPLFRTFAVVHNGSFRGEVGQSYEFPFVIGFPDQTQLGGGLFDQKQGGYFHSTPGKTLPPTMFLSYHGFAHRFDCFVEYKLGVAASMPGIGVAISTSEEVAIQYAQPGIRRDSVIYRTLDAKRIFEVSNAHLLPPAERPSGFREKTKAFFSTDYFPKFSFEVVHQCPQYLYVSERPEFMIRIRHLLETSTAPLVPDITLESFNLSLKALTDVRAERQIMFEQTSRGEETVYSCWNGRFGPFEKSRDWTKQVRGIPLPRTFTPSFTTYNINRRYEIKVKWVIGCAEKSFDIERTYSVVVNPSHLSEATEESSSSAPLQNFSGMEQVLQDGTAGPGEELPTYQEAAGDVAPPPIQPLSTNSSGEDLSATYGDPPPFDKEHETINKVDGEVSNTTNSSSKV